MDRLSADASSVARGTSSADQWRCSVPKCPEHKRLMLRHCVVGNCAWRRCPTQECKEMYDTAGKRWAGR